MNEQTWIDEQTIWINDQQKAYKKTCSRYILAVLIGATAALFALGYFVGGFAIAVQNGFFGLILGLLISLFCVLAFRTKAPRKCYLKSLKKEMARVFADDYQRGCFVREMLEAARNNTTKKIVWERSGGRTGKVEISKEYAIEYWENSVTVIKLGQIERMELTEEILNIATKTEYGTVRHHQENYPISFFYRDTEVADSRKKKMSDKRFNFPTKELRDQTAGAIEIM